MEQIGTLLIVLSPLRTSLTSELWGVPVGSIGATGILGIVVLLVLMGKLVPRRSMEDAIKDRDDWRAAHGVSEEARIELQQQVGELLQLSRLTTTFIQTIPLGVMKSREEGGGNVAP